MGRNVTVYIMEKIKLICEEKGGKKVYTAITNDGHIVYKSAPTRKTYVSIMLDEKTALYRFGRLQLIGKGDSSDLYRTQNYKYLAVIPEIEKLVTVGQPETLNSKFERVIHECYRHWLPRPFALEGC